MLRELVVLVNQDRATTASLLAHLAEVDTRRLYLPAGYPSMFAYCVHELHLCEQAAFTRIRAARTAREFPAVFSALAEGRLHLSAVVQLAPHLIPDNADELLAAATHKTKVEIEQLLARQFPQPDVPTRVQALPAPRSPVRRDDQLFPGIVAQPSTPTLDQLSPGIVASGSETFVEAPRTLSTMRAAEGPKERAKVAPLAPRRYALQLTMSQELYDKLRHAQELLSHQIPAGDVAAVLERALDALIPQLEKRKFAATDRPHAARPTGGARHVPAHIKRAVWQRDGGQCTFVSETGHRCPSRTFLEFDHIDEVALGGRASIGRMRLRCRAHNQYAAERTFGVEFMRRKRNEARRCAGAAHAQAASGSGVALAGAPSG